MRLTEAFRLDFAQSEVDFVIPDLATDLPLCIDPFLLYKSKDPSMREFHNRLLSVFNQGIQLYGQGNQKELDRLIDFPEVNEIGFGYSEGRIRGSGLGTQLNRVLSDTLSASHALQERGLRHVEELQLVSIGVGADRVSDIAANALKTFLIEYTVEQATLWHIPLKSGVPVAHYFEFSDWEWSDGYFDLPVNPVTGKPILLVPRRIVRLLPWINYEDYIGSDFKMFLRPRLTQRLPRYPGMPRVEREELAKKEVVKTTRQQLSLLDQYVGRKEREGHKAEPLLGSDESDDAADSELADRFIGRLDLLPIGQAAASDYQRLVLEILNYLFEPELTDGEMEVRTYLQTERRDIIYTNEAERSFWAYARETYDSLLVMFEVKNVSGLEIDHIAQTASYLGVRLGMLGFVITRQSPGDNIVRKTYSIHNDTPSTPRKTILILCDEDLKKMVRLKREGKDPVKHVQSMYRDFRKRIQ